MKKSLSFGLVAVSITALALLAGCGSSEKSSSPPPASGGGTHTMDGKVMKDKDMK